MNWYVVATKSNGERIAEHNLTKQDYEVLLPVLEKTRRHARWIDTVWRPLFPGYLFVRLGSLTTSWRAINGTFGVLRLLTNDGQPQPICEDFISALKLRITDSGTIKDIILDYLAGDKVEIISNAVQGHLAKVLSAENNIRIKVLLAMMGGGSNFHYFGR